MDPQRAAIAEAICWARRGQRVSVRVLLERMDLPLSSSRYVRFESARRTLSEEVTASICRVLGLDLDQVTQDAAAALTRANQPAAAEPVAAGPLRGAVPQVTAIRVKVEQVR